MTTAPTYNLDENVRESFKFTVKGYEYEFKQLNTEELEQFQTLKGDKEIREWLYKFITPVGEEAPKFVEVAKSMLSPHWKNFITMVKAEMGIE